jgi:hypothetical protein
MADDTTGTPAAPANGNGSDVPDDCPDCGHERVAGFIAVICTFGLLGIAAYCCWYQPAYWGPIDTICTFFSVQVASYMGYRQGRRAGARVAKS